MGLFYGNHEIAVLIGTKSGTTPTGAALTTSYQTEAGTQPTKSFASGGFSKLDLEINYTTGASETGTSVQLKLEASPDKVNWYQLTNESATSGTSTLYNREFTHAGGAGATAYTFTLGIDIFYKFMRVSAKESSVSSNAGTVYVEATLSGK